jgi:RNA polymerase sigma-70 factor (ECF subfamily)
MKKMDEARDFEAVLRETQSALRAYIAGMGVPLDVVDDLAQDVYLEYYRGRGRRPADVEPIRWLKGIAKNLCMNYFRRSKRSAAQQHEAMAALLERMSSTLESVHEPAPLDGCLDRLPDRSREMIDARYRDGKSSDAIGRSLGMTPEAVRIGLLRIRASLRDCLERRVAPGGSA